jgi:hypothetical protein
MPRKPVVTFHVCPVPTRGVVTIMVAVSGKRVHAGMFELRLGVWERCDAASPRDPDCASGSTRRSPLVAVPGPDLRIVGTPDLPDARSLEWRARWWRRLRCRVLRDILAVNGHSHRHGWRWWRDEGEASAD